MIWIAFIAGCFVGATFGAIGMAILSINPPEAI